MNKEQFILKDYYDMLNLHKALLEAKFHENPDNLYVAGSPIIANIYNRLLDTIQEYEIEKKGKENWSEWRRIQNQKFYKDRAIRNIIECEKWRTFDNKKKMEIIYNYLSPFTFTEDELQEIMNEIDDFAS